MSRFHRSWPAAALLAVTLAACGTTEPAAQQSASTPAAGATTTSSSSSSSSTTTGSSASSAATGSSASSATTGPITITDGAGRTVTLDAPAKRVVALEWREAEIVASLGITPVAIADLKGYTTWDAAAPMAPSVQDVGTRNEPSVDAIVGLDPDLIVMTGGRAIADKAESLGKQFPVIVTQGSTTEGQFELLAKEVRMIASATGTEAKGEELVAAMQAKLAEGKQAISAAGAAGSPFLMADGWKEGSTVSIRMFAKGSLVSDIGEELGLQNAWTTAGDAAYGLGQTDVEGLAKLTDPKVRFFYSASEDDPFADGLAGNAIWDGLPFVKSDQLTKLTKGSWTFGGPASVESFVDQFVSAYQG